MCTWTSAGGVWTKTTFVHNLCWESEQHTLSVAVCMDMPGADSVPSAPGETLVRNKTPIKNIFNVFTLTRCCCCIQLTMQSCATCLQVEEAQIV